MEQQKSRILIVDDEQDICALIGDVLQDEGYETQTANSIAEAQEAFAVFKPDLAVLDIWLQASNEDGLELLKSFKKQDPEMSVLMISGHGNIETAVSAIKDGAYDFIEKPFQSDRLLILVQRALEASSLRRENKSLRFVGSETYEIQGESHPVQIIRQVVERAAPTNSRVLITGEAGCGKEVVARMIHNQSTRAQEMFVTLNCATMHPERVEEELFGVVHNGVMREGALQRANGGTLYLDEVSDMPMQTQTKIVRVLQDQTFMPIGGDEMVHTDCRVLASSNRDLQDLCAQGVFREDLYYRLNVVPIYVPGLRDRGKDIEALSAQLIKQISQANGMSPREISAGALAAMQRFDWPGNVRQLKNVLEWVMIMLSHKAHDYVIALDDLPADVSGCAPRTMQNAGEVDYLTLPLRDARELFEKEYLLSQIERFGGNISKTAKFVEMERSALHRKLKTLGLQTSTEDVSPDKKVA